MPVITSEELSLCDCCALMVANGDESGCRDFYGHTHQATELPIGTVMAGDSLETARGFTCDGCQEDQGPLANEWPAVVLVQAPEHVNYPHEDGRLFDCPACEASCHCTPGHTECVFEGVHNGTAAD